MLFLVTNPWQGWVVAFKLALSRFSLVNELLEDFWKAEKPKKKTWEDFPFLTEFKLLRPLTASGLNSAARETSEQTMFIFIFRTFEQGYAQDLRFIRARIFWFENLKCNQWTRQFANQWTSQFAALLHDSLLYSLPSLCPSIGYVIHRMSPPSICRSLSSLPLLSSLPHAITLLALRAKLKQVVTNTITLLP